MQYIVTNIVIPPPKKAVKRMGIRFMAEYMVKTLVYYPESLHYLSAHFKL